MARKRSPSRKKSEAEKENQADDSPVFAKPAPKRRREQKSSSDDASSKNSDSTNASDERRSLNKKKQSDAQLVADVKAFMKGKKLGQVQVGREARISQAVISQWLSLKYHGHNDKVDAAMRTWLDARQSGEVVGVAQAGQPTSVLRPMQRPSARKAQAADSAVRSASRKAAAAAAEAVAVQQGGHRPTAQEVVEMQKLQAEAAKDGAMFREYLEDEAMEMNRPPSLSDALGDVGKRTPKMLRHGYKLDPSMPSPFRNLMSPGQFAPVGITGSSQTPVGLPTPGRSPAPNSAPPPFWAVVNSRTPSGTPNAAATQVTSTSTSPYRLSKPGQASPFRMSGGSPFSASRGSPLSISGGSPYPTSEPAESPYGQAAGSGSPFSKSAASPFGQSDFVFKMQAETPIDAEAAARLSLASNTSVVGVVSDMSSPDSPNEEAARRSPRFAKKLLWTPGGGLQAPYGSESPMDYNPRRESFVGAAAALHEREQAALNMPMLERALLSELTAE